MLETTFSHGKLIAPLSEGAWLLVNGPVELLASQRVSGRALRMLEGTLALGQSVAPRPEPALNLALRLREGGLGKGRLGLVSFDMAKLALPIFKVPAVLPELANLVLHDSIYYIKREQLIDDCFVFKF